jgi:hypothetical protein
MKRKCLVTFFFEKKSLDFQKIKNHVVTFPWFRFGNNFFNVLIGS